MIKKNLVKMCLEMFAAIAEQKYDCKNFHELFGKYLKFGIHEYSMNRRKIESADDRRNGWEGPAGAG